ncbi:hypothetical protein RUND412_004566 [Rhizina undulata]
MTKTIVAALEPVEEKLQRHWKMTLHPRVEKKATPLRVERKVTPPRVERKGEESDTAGTKTENRADASDPNSQDYQTPWEASDDAREASNSIRGLSNGSGDETDISGEVKTNNGAGGPGKAAGCVGASQAPEGQLLQGNSNFATPAKASLTKTVEEKVRENSKLACQCMSVKYNKKFSVQTFEVDQYMTLTIDHLDRASTDNRRMICRVLDMPHADHHKLRCVYRLLKGLHLTRELQAVNEVIGTQQSPLKN